MAGRRPSAARSARVKANVSKGRAAAESLWRQLAGDGVGDVLAEYRFHPTRRWRFDMAWPNRMLAVEIEGGAFVKGAHTRGAHFRSDCEKYNEAAILGWRVLRVMPEHVKSGQAAEWVRRAAGVA